MYTFHTHTEYLQAFSRYQAQRMPQQILKNEYHRDNPLTTMYEFKTNTIHIYELKKSTYGVFCQEDIITNITEYFQTIVEVKLLVAQSVNRG